MMKKKKRSGTGGMDLIFDLSFILSMTSFLVCAICVRASCMWWRGDLRVQYGVYNNPLSSDILSLGVNRCDVSFSTVVGFLEFRNERHYQYLSSLDHIPWNPMEWFLGFVDKIKDWCGERGS